MSSNFTNKKNDNYATHFRLWEFILFHYLRPLNFLRVNLRYFVFFDFRMHLDGWTLVWLMKFTYLFWGFEGLWIYFSYKLMNFRIVVLEEEGDNTLEEYNARI